MKCVSALSTARSASTAFHHILERLDVDPDGAPADFTVIFSSRHHASVLGKLSEAFLEQGRTNHVLGCTGEAVVGEDQEIEGKPALSVWSLHSSGAEIQPIRFDPGGGSMRQALASLEGPAESTLILLADPFSFGMNDLLKLANQKAGQLTYASPGAGSQAHLAGELLQLEANVKMIHVPYRGVSPAMTDLVGGQVTMMIAQVQSALPYIKSGKLHAIGVASPKRSPLLPDVPTIAEQGFPKFEAISWYALMAPANTPRDVLNKLNQHTNTALAETTVKEKLAGLGMKATGGTPEQLSSAIQSESTRWADVIRKRNITVD